MSYVCMRTKHVVFVVLVKWFRLGYRVFCQVYALVSLCFVKCCVLYLEEEEEEEDEGVAMSSVVSAVDVDVMNT